jgi:hypothetical protein
MSHICSVNELPSPLLRELVLIVFTHSNHSWDPLVSLWSLGPSPEIASCANSTSGGILALSSSSPSTSEKGSAQRLYLGRFPLVLRRDGSSEPTSSSTGNYSNFLFKASSGASPMLCGALHVSVGTAADVLPLCSPICVLGCMCVLPVHA